MKVTQTSILGLMSRNDSLKRVSNRFYWTLISTNASWM